MISHLHKKPWKLTRSEGKAGTGNWEAFPAERMDDIFKAAESWRLSLKGVNRPWLCWCVDEEWCLLQQKLVSSVGWTPIVGTDGAFARPKLIPEAVFVDFNSDLKLPAMWMHFPLEFVFLYTDRLAYWHSDLLPPVPIMKEIASEFSSVVGGEMIGMHKRRVGLKQLIQRMRRRKPWFYRRWLEFVGITTAGASQSQFNHGCGWWRNPQFHPNVNTKVVRANPWREHGVGIYLWVSLFNGPARELKVDIDAYHYCASHPDYVRKRDRMGKIEGSKREELLWSFDLEEIRGGLGLKT